MNEKLKGFLSKDNPSDEELEIFLLAENNQCVGLRMAIDQICAYIDEHREIVDAWVIPRLRSEVPMSTGLKQEIKSAMRTLADLQIYLESTVDFVQLIEEQALDKYREADAFGHFHWKEKLASAGAPARED